MQIKSKLKKTIVYSIYIKVKYFIYPLQLKLAKIDKKKPTSIIIEKNNKKENRIIVSLTSFPGRIHIVHKTIYSIMNQTYKPDMIIIWLSKKQFPQMEKELPKKLGELEKQGLTIKWTEDDLKSYKKLIPALKAYPEDIIVTADDDLYYPADWLENLITSYKLHPEDIHCHLITRLIKKEGNFYVGQRDNNMIDTASFYNKILGGSGTLYPPHSLDSEVFNIKKFQSIAPTSDDIWFWAMALKNNTKIRWIKNHMKKLYYIEHSQEETDCLWKINDCGEKLFSVHLNDVVKKYNLYDQIGSDEYEKEDKKIYKTNNT